MASLKAQEGTLKRVLSESGWVDGELLAVGQLRQGKIHSTASMVTGTALIEVLRPRRSKLVPRHFVLAVTKDRVVALKASGVTLDETEYWIHIKPGEQGSWPRDAIHLTDLEEGDRSKEGTLEIQTDSGPERIPVARPNLDADADTDELFRLLGR